MLELLGLQRYEIMYQDKELINKAGEPRAYDLLTNINT